MRSDKVKEKQIFSYLLLNSNTQSSERTEDSLVFRQLLVRGLQADEAVEVVAVAGDPYQARDAIIKYNPDVMTLDLELPRMGGLEFLRKLIPQRPVPTVVISSLSDKVFDALHAGAVDFVAKPSGMTAESLSGFIRNELVTKIKIASTAHIENHKQANVGNAHIHHNPMTAHKVIAIGASTGGTEAIYEVISRFEKDIPGVVVVQHMPPGFTNMYAQRLNRQCAVMVKEAETGDKIEPGKVLIAPGDKQMRVIKVGSEYQVECRQGERVSGHCPSVDVLFHSVAKNVGRSAVGVILTGMGCDGTVGLIVEKIAEVVTIPEDNIVPPPVLNTNYTKNSYVYGLGKIDGAVKMLLDPEKLIKDDELGVLEQLAAENNTVNEEEEEL